MGKFLIGVATAALWFVLSHAANAEQVRGQVCNAGTCVSKSFDHPGLHRQVRLVQRSAL
ncbi:MAG: hypothetical protein WBD53_21090 [Xanthobacteraceae bacterium]